MSDTKKHATSTSASDKAFGGFTDEERAAMKEHAQELLLPARAEVQDEVRDVRLQ